MTAVARRARVTGRVQGVFFRAWTREEAERLDIAGWVRNSPDGAVEAYVEGDPGAVEQLIALLHEGPPHARVDKVEVSEAAVEGCRSFDVRH